MSRSQLGVKFLFFFSGFLHVISPILLMKLTSFPFFLEIGLIALGVSVVDLTLSSWHHNVNVLKQQKC